MSSSGCAKKDDRERDPGAGNGDAKQEAPHEANEDETTPEPDRLPPVSVPRLFVESVEHKRSTKEALALVPNGSEEWVVVRSPSVFAEAGRRSAPRR